MTSLLKKYNLTLKCKFFSSKLYKYRYLGKKNPHLSMIAYSYENAMSEKTIGYSCSSVTVVSFILGQLFSMKLLVAL